MCRVLASSLRGPRSAHRCARAKTPRRRRPRDDARNEVAPPPLPLKWTRPCLADAEQFAVVPHAAVAGVPPPSLMRNVHGRWGHARRGSARDSSCCTLLRRAQPPRRHGRRASSRRSAAALFASLRCGGVGGTELGFWIGRLFCSDRERYGPSDSIEWL